MSPPGVRPDEVVPVAMEPIALEIERLHLFVRHSAARRVLPVVETAYHLQSLRRGRLGD